MERRTRFARQAVVIVAAASVLAACGSDDKEQALQLARKACNMDFPNVHGDPLTDAAARQRSRDEVLPRMEEAADKAAEAARLDDTWQPLATAYNRDADMISVSLDLADLRATRVDGGYSNPADVDRDTQLDARRTKLINSMDEPSVNAECRKTKGSS